MFAKCDLCVAIKEEKQKARSMEQRDALNDLACRHNSLQMFAAFCGKGCKQLFIVLNFPRNERMDYYQRIDSALSFPSDFLSIIIDSMDQSKLMVPRLANQRKATSDLWSLRTHLIGN